MNYIIFDLEFNQSYNSSKENKCIVNKDCPFEIIQIGAVKLNERLQSIGNIDRLVKPVIYTVLNPFVEKLTGITINDLNSANSFKEIYAEFIDFIGNDETMLCVWGKADIKELFRNIQYHQLDTSSISKKYIDLQRYASRYLNCPKGTSIGLSNAVKLLNISFKNEFHNAFADAYYTAEIFKKIYNEKLEPKIYNHSRHNRLNTYSKEKKNIDTHGLIKQFEKMFNRKMTEEEIKIIKLAYIMGKTNQFQIKSYDNLNK